MDKKYSIIYADPAWSYNDKSMNRGGAERHYDTMSIEDIKILPINDISAENSVLFIWATFPMLQEALDVIKAWGFTYKTIGFNWVKTNKLTNVNQTSFLPTESFDVFTPQLRLTDATVYTVASYTTSSLTRAWSVVVGTVDTVTGSTATLDLGIGGNYYDAAYTGGFATTVVYAHTSLTYLSIKDIISGTVETTANTPPDTCSLLAYLTTIKARMDELVDSCQPYERAKADYEYAASLYFLILEKLKAESTSGVIDYVEEFLTIYFNTEPPYINTNAIIPPYVFCYATGGGSGSGNITKFFATIATSASSFTNATFNGKSLLLTASEGLVLRDTDVDLVDDTVSKTNSGDEFVAGTWYLFLLKEN